MKRRALLIGSQTGLLRGVENDITRMRAAIERFDFDSVVCVAGDATRRGILDRYEQLITEARRDDAVLVYYTGHGALALNPDYRARDGEPRFFQFIVPTDIRESSYDDFRGVLNIELSARLARLTEKTRNVTVILDCCHAARMSRTGLVRKSLSGVWDIGLDAHLASVSRGSSSSPYVESNPHAVRLVASAVNQAAFEYSNAAGERVSVFTESLTNELSRQGIRESTPVWIEVACRVFERVSALMPTQRASIEGPHRRVLFETREGEVGGALTLFIGERGAPTLRGGSLAGVQLGDVYELSARAGTMVQRVVESVVEEVGPSWARVRLPPGLDRSALIEGSLARLLRRARRRAHVFLEASARVEPSRTWLRGALECVGIELVETTEHAHIARIALRGDCLAVRDVEGLTVGDDAPLTPVSLDACAHNLRALAHARMVRTLPSGSGEHALEANVDIEWGRVHAGGLEPLPTVGAIVMTGDALWVRVFNRDAELLYVSILDIGVSGRVTLLTASEPSGVELATCEHYTLGADELGDVRGLPLSWPARAPEDMNRAETIVVVLTDRPMDLRALELDGFRYLESLASRRRVRGGQRTSGARYAVETIDFRVLPPSAVTGIEAGPAFVTDLRPPLSTLLSDAPACEVELAVALEVRSRARALVELHVLVATIDDAGALRYEATTRAFTRGETATIEAYSGPANRVVALAAWRSTGDAERPELQELLVGTPVGGSATEGMDPVALCIAALKTSSALISFADRRLRDEREEVVPLLRIARPITAPLQDVREPTRGRLRVGELRVAYRVIARGARRSP